MANIISFDTGNGENDIVFVNADTITHWHKADNDDQSTVIHFIGGGTLTIQDDVWWPLCQIDPPPPEPAIVSTTKRLLAGSFTPGQQVTVESVHTRADGSTDTHLHETTFKEIEHNDYTGKDYYVCVGGTFDGSPSRGEDATFLFDVDQFTSTTSNT